MELSAPDRTLQQQQRPCRPVLSDYERPSGARIWQLRQQMRAGLVQPLDKHEAHYVEIQKYNVLVGEIGSLPAMLRPNRQQRLAIQGPPEEMPKPISFPSFHPTDPTMQQRLIQQSAVAHSHPSGALMSTSLISTVATRATQLLRGNISAGEVKEEEEEDLISATVESGGDETELQPARVKHSPPSTPSIRKCRARSSTLAQPSDIVASTNEQPRAKRTARTDDFATTAKKIKVDTTQSQIDEYFPQGAESSSANRGGRPEVIDLTEGEVIDLTETPTPGRTFVPEERHTRETHTAHLGIETLLQVAGPSSPSPSGVGQPRRRSQRIANLNSTANRHRTTTQGFPQSQADVLNQLQDTGSVDTIATLPAGTRIRVRAEVIKDEDGSVVPEVKVED